MIDVSWMERLGVLLVRPGMMVMTAPGIGGRFAPGLVKIGLTVLLAVLLAPLVDLSALEGAGLPIVIGRELLIGVALAMAVRVVIAGAELGGYLAGFHLGFAYGAIIDPQSGARNNMISALYGSLTVVTFLLLEGHHAVIRALAVSYEALPIGAGAGGAEGTMVTTVAALLGLIFTLGVQLAAPLMIALLLVEVALGLVARSAPAFNLMVLGFPLRLLVGLLVLATAVRAVPTVISGVLAPALDLAGQLAGALR